MNILSKKRMFQYAKGAAIFVSVASICVFTLFLALDYLYPYPSEKLSRDPSVTVYDKNNTPLRFFLSKDKTWRFPVELDDISPDLLEAVIQSEDKWFYHHPGVNPLAVIRAAYVNIKEGRVVSGASTIPMQIARLAEPKPRTIYSKLEEAFRAFQLKWHYQNSELLEFYLNLAPYGGNIEGIGAASYFYFGKTPRALEPHEIALLTVLPRSPSKFDPTRNPKTAIEQRNKVLKELSVNNVIKVHNLLGELNKPVPATRTKIPFFAPHFTDYIYREFTVSGDITTTLDLSVQLSVQRVVRRHIENLRARGIKNLAVVVIENDSRGVTAMLGSNNFFENEYAGQVNAALSRRSPGSALKPFLYAAAIDKGIMVPGTYMLDIPTDYSGYIAKNYDGKYRGRITMRHALILSLNVPSVRLLSNYGLKDFHSLLLDGGLNTLDRQSMEYGLPLILGAGEVTLLDLTNLYASFAEGGIHRPVNIRMSGKTDDFNERRLFSRESAYLITEILTDLKRPDMPSRSWALTQDVPEVAWKTGTSYGHRDAWSIGYSGRYTVGVWVGNPDGRGVNGMSGSEHAAPILFDIFRSIQGDGGGVEKPAGLNISEIEVCRDSHMLPTSFCDKREKIVYIPGVSRIAKDNIARRFFVDSETGDLLIGDCIGERPHEPRVFNVYPPELTAWRHVQNISVSRIPPVSPLCKDVPSQSPPVIISPDGTTDYRVLKSMPADYQKVQLKARVSEGVEKLFWYDNGKLIRSASPAENIFIPLSAGINNISVVDSSGRSDSLSYRVQFK